jgi:uncharacterized protein (TIGR02588 family)
MKPSNRHERNSKNPLEWTVFGTCALLVFATAGTLIHEMLDEARPAELTVALGETRRLGHWWSMAVTVRNRGREAAEDIEVLVTADDGGAAAACHFDHIPGGAERKGSALFARSPTEPPKAEVIGFRTP